MKKYFRLKDYIRWVKIQTEEERIEDTWLKILQIYTSQRFPKPMISNFTRWIRFKIFQSPPQLYHFSIEDHIFFISSFSSIFFSYRFLCTRFLWNGSNFVKQPQQKLNRWPLKISIPNISRTVTYFKHWVNKSQLFKGKYYETAIFP